MAVNSGFGSALTGFGKGYLNALQFGERQKQGYLGTKLKQDDLAFRRSQELSNDAFRKWQMEDARQTAADRRASDKLSANDRALGLRNQANIAAANALSEDIKVISGLKGPDQIRAWNTAQNKQRQILSGVYKPEDIEQHVGSVLPKPGSIIPGITQPGLIPDAQSGDPQLINRQQFEQTRGKELMPGETPTFIDDAKKTAFQVGSSQFDPRQDAMMKMLAGGMASRGGMNPVGMANLAGSIGAMYNPQAAGVNDDRFTYQMPMSTKMGEVPAVASYDLGAIDKAGIESKQADTNLKRQKFQIVDATKPEIIKQAELKTKLMTANILNIASMPEYRKAMVEINAGKLALAQSIGNARIAIDNAKLSQGDKRLALQEAGLQLNSTIQPLRLAAAAEVSIGKLVQAKGAPGLQPADLANIDKLIGEARKDKQRFEALHFMLNDQNGAFMDSMMDLTTNQGMTDEAALNKLVGWSTGVSVSDRPFTPGANPVYTGIKNNVKRNVVMPGTNPSAEGAAEAARKIRTNNPLNLRPGQHPGPGASRPGRDYNRR